CHAGTRTCGDEGTWGPCEGELLPHAGDCASCDGNVAPCTGATLFAKSFGPTGPWGFQIAIDSSGRVVVDGLYGGSPSAGIDFGLGPLSPSNGAAFLLAMDASGKALWNYGYDKTFLGGLSIDWLNGDATDFASSTIGAAVTRLDKSGTVLWDQTF